MIGLLVTIIIKFLIFRILRNKLYTSLYRKLPAASNIISLLLECCNIGLSAGFVVVRAIKLVLVAIMYVGRIDTPILFPGVGKLLGWEPDTYPIVIRKDILAHEAHRHPYIELLGGMYLMKLRYGSNFAKTAGSCWRILFVFALMPWLRKYRVMARPVLTNNKQDDDDDDIDDGTIFMDAATFASTNALYRNYGRKVPSGMDDKDKIKRSSSGGSSRSSDSKNKFEDVKKSERSSSSKLKDFKKNERSARRSNNRGRSASDGDLKKSVNSDKKKRRRFEC